MLSIRVVNVMGGLSRSEGVNTDVFNHSITVRFSH